MFLAHFDQREKRIRSFSRGVLNGEKNSAGESELPARMNTFGRASLSLGFERRSHVLSVDKTDEAVPRPKRATARFELRASPTRGANQNHLNL